VVISKKIFTRYAYCFASSILVVRSQPKQLSYAQTNGLRSGEIEAMPVCALGIFASASDSMQCHQDGI
jgi:hypothetical protein